MHSAVKLPRTGGTPGGPARLLQLDVPRHGWGHAQAPQMPKAGVVAGSPFPSEDVPGWRTVTASLGKGLCRAGCPHRPPESLDLQIQVRDMRLAGLCRLCGCTEASCARGLAQPVGCREREESSRTPAGSFAPVCTAPSEKEASRGR